MRFAFRVLWLHPRRLKTNWGKKKFREKLGCGTLTRVHVSRFLHTTYCSTFRAGRTSTLSIVCTYYIAGVYEPAFGKLMNSCTNVVMPLPKIVRDVGKEGGSSKDSGREGGREGKRRREREGGKERESASAAGREIREREAESHDFVS